MIVLVAGMPRSGSTFSYNIVRELLSRRGTVRTEHDFDFVSLVKHESQADHLVLKAHEADGLVCRLVGLGAIKAICTVRKPEDAIASWMQTFGFDLDQSLDVMCKWLAMYAQIRRHALVIDYDQIDRHPVLAALRIRAFVDPGAGMLVSAAIARRYAKRAVAERTSAMRPDEKGVRDISFSYYDEKTFLHRRHVSGLISRPACEKIGNAAVSAIRARLAAWVDARGTLRLQ